MRWSPLPEHGAAFLHRSGIRRPAGNALMGQEQRRRNDHPDRLWRGADDETPFRLFSLAQAPFRIR